MTRPCPRKDDTLRHEGAVNPIEVEGNSLLPVSVLEVRKAAGALLGDTVPGPNDLPAGVFKNLRAFRGRLAELFTLILRTGRILLTNAAAPDRPTRKAEEAPFVMRGQATDLLDLCESKALGGSGSTSNPPNR